MTGRRKRPQTSAEASHVYPQHSDQGIRRNGSSGSSGSDSDSDMGVHSERAEGSDESDSSASVSDDGSDGEEESEDDLESEEEQGIHGDMYGTNTKEFPDGEGPMDHIAATKALLNSGGPLCLEVLVEGSQYTRMWAMQDLQTTVRCKPTWQLLCSSLSPLALAPRLRSLPPRSRSLPPIRVALASLPPPPSPPSLPLAPPRSSLSLRRRKSAFPPPPESSCDTWLSHGGSSWIEEHCGALFQSSCLVIPDTQTNVAGKRRGGLSSWNHSHYFQYWKAGCKS